MNDLIGYVDELRELLALYQQNELREFDIALMIHQREQEIAQFEQAMEQDLAEFNSVKYSTTREV